MTRYKNFAGQKFGHLLALESTEKLDKFRLRLWTFKCDCGSVIVRAAASVKRQVELGYEPACSHDCPTKRPFQVFYENGFSGKVFGKLTAVEPTGSYDAKGFPTWKFLCVCGDIVERSAHNVYHDEQDGHIQSCGKKSCRRIYTLKTGRAARNQVVLGYRTNAKKKGLEFTLTEEKIDKLFSSNCHYCGAPPCNTAHQKSSFNGAFTYNGIDRKDNRKGYTPQNVVPCCYICNHAKATMSYEEFLDWVERLTEYQAENIRD